MSAVPFFSWSLRELHESMDEATKSLTPEQVHWRPGGRVNHIGFILWHYVRTQDNVIRFVLQRRPTIWMEGGWDKRFGLDSKTQGTGMSQEDALKLRINSLEDFRTYMHLVFKETEDYVAKATEADLARVVVVKPLGEMSVEHVLGHTILTHGFGHLGEIWTVRGMLGMPGNPI